MHTTNTISSTDKVQFRSLPKPVKGLAARLAEIHGDILVARELLDMKRGRRTTST
ncbi:hypothetical protein H5P28_10600 [Ruficoccus amylovorans]|uniref:Uncharacterized protein n=1 Tax=Ruficoccus amylovorans TaxID=1804625 RepID=A0A842HEQ8_9BACT|nr:hypothetical protein [Ruficoccus amylovorans]MBC2594710.1 hypothetical protein [Ruficoccus amylovorans]